MSGGGVDVVCALGTTAPLDGHEAACAGGKILAANARAALDRGRGLGRH